MPLSDSGESLPAEEIAGIIDGLFSNEESTFQGFSAPPVGRSFGGQPLLGAQSGPDLFGGQSFSNNRQSSGNLPSLKDAKRANDIRNQFSGGNQFGGGFGAASAGPSAGGASASGFTGAGSGNSASGLGGGFPGQGGGGGGLSGGGIAALIGATAVAQGFGDRQPEGGFFSRFQEGALPSPAKNLGLTEGSEFNAKEFGIGTFAPFLNFFREPNTPGQEDGGVILQDFGMSSGQSGNNRNSSGGGGSFIGDLIGGLFG